MALITALLVRNEAGVDRYFTRVLATCQRFSDRILVLDDQSTDETADVARSFGADVRVRAPSVPHAWGNEAPARQELWAWADAVCTGPRDWVLVCDADMELHGDPRPLCQSDELNSWGMVLFDAWSTTEYRSDAFWMGHRVPRVWLVAPKRVPEDWQARWPTRGLHCGHLPENFALRTGVAPADVYFVHWAYATPEQRQAKHAQYLAKAHLLTDFEKRHADSILSPP